MQMRKTSLILLILPLVALACQNHKGNELKSELLPQITQAYKAQDWDKIIQLTDSLRNSGLSYSEYNSDGAYDMPYCEALIAIGRAKDAIEEIQNHVEKLNPKDYYAYNTLGDAYMVLQDTTKALQAYEKSIEIRPTYARPYVKLGRILSNTDLDSSSINYSYAIQLLGDHELYEDVLSIGFEALDVDSTNIIVLKYMGDACMSKKDMQSAKAFYRTVLRDADKSGSTIPSIFYESDFKLAFIEYLEGNFEGVYSLLEIIYANEQGLEKSTESNLFGAYVLGAAATHYMNEPIVSNKLLNKAKEIDSKVAEEDYKQFLSMVDPN